MIDLIACGEKFTVLSVAIKGERFQKKSPAQSQLS